MRQSQHRLISMFTLVFAALVGCAACQTDLGIDQSRFVCSDHSDCTSGWHCNAESVCEQGPRPTQDTGADDVDPRVDATNDTSGSEDTLSPPEDTRDGSSDGDASSEDADASSEDADASQDCAGECPVGTKCDPRGPRCVDEDACISANDCDIGQFCDKDTNECLYGVCQVHGDRCNPADSIQNGFHCIVAYPNAPYGFCSEPCHRAHTRSTCDVNDSFCMPAGPAADVCRVTQCASSSDCGLGFECRDIAGGYSQCVSEGTITKGGDCSSASCETTLTCDRQARGGDDTCRERCNPWAASPECEPDQVCAYLYPRLGVCRPAPTSQQGAYEDCSAAGGACADGSRCMPDPRADKSGLVCVPLCRMNQSGRGDCASVDVIVGSNNMVPTGCNRHALPGTQDIGACTPQCNSRDDCPADSNDVGECVNDLCRRTCQTDDDCGAGESPWICDGNGHCN